VAMGQTLFRRACRLEVSVALRYEMEYTVVYLSYIGTMDNYT